MISLRGTNSNQKSLYNFTRKTANWRIAGAMFTDVIVLRHPPPHKNLCFTLFLYFRPVKKVLLSSLVVFGDPQFVIRKIVIILDGTMPSVQKWIHVQLSQSVDSKYP